MATWKDFLAGADGLADIYGKVKVINDGPVEATAPIPDPDRQVLDEGTFKGFSQYGLQSSVDVVGLIALVYLLVSK